MNALRIAASVALIGLLAPRAAHAEREAGAADASTITTEPVRVIAEDDPWERGHSTLAAPRPIKTMRLRACGLRAPVCVHGPAGAEAEVLDALRLAEDAHAITTGALRLPSPDRDPATGALDLYLVDGPGDDARTRLAGRDPVAIFDRASAFIELPRQLTGCLREAAIHRALVRASLLRIAPASSEGVAIPVASHFTRLTLPCAASRVEDVAAFQREPARAIADAGEGELDRRFSRGASIFYDWADTRFGAAPGALMRATMALTPTKSPAGARHFVSRPDAFDVLRESFKDALSLNTSLDDLFYRFAVARATFGPRVDPATFLPARAWGDAVKVHLDHAIEWPHEPRRFLSPKPIAPTGISVFAVRRAGAPSRTRLRIEAEWEEHSRFRFAAIKLDASGAPIGTVLVPATPRATAAQSTVTELDTTDVVLVVAMNSGDFARPFDPDDRAWERHAFLLTLASE